MRIDDDKLLEYYKSIWTNIEDFKNIELDFLPVYDNRYIKTKIRTYGDKVYTNIRSFKVSQDGVECESFTVISINFLPLSNNKFYLKVYLDNCAYKIVDKQMIEYVDSNLLIAMKIIFCLMPLTNVVLQ